MNLEQIIARLAEIDKEIRSAQDIDAVETLKTEKESLLVRKGELEDLEARKSIALKLENGEMRGKEMEVTQRQKDMVYGPDSKEYREAFFKRLLGKPLSEVEERAYTSASNSAGAVIPTQTADVLFDKMVSIAPMINEITLLRVAGNVRFAVEGTRAAAAAHTENAAVTPANDALVYVDLAGFERIKVIRISKTVQTMSINAFESWLVEMISEDIAVKLEDDIINGDGATGPKGVEYAATYTPGTNAVEFTNAGNPTFDNVMDLISYLPQRYHGGAKFLCNSKFLYGKLAKIKDDQKQPILVKDMADGLKFRIMGFPVLLSDKVADNTMYLGNYKKIVGNMPQGIEVEASTQSGFLNNSIDFRGTVIFDCDIALTDAFVKLSEASV